MYNYISKNNQSAFLIPKLYNVRVETGVITLQFYTQDQKLNNMFIQELKANPGEFIEQICGTNTIIKWD